MKRLRYSFFFVLVILATACSRQEALPQQPVASTRVKIQVATDGFYRVSHDALRQAGFTVDSFASNQFHLSQAGQPVPYVVDGDAIIFYGHAPDSRYTAIRPYVLEAGIAAVLMEEIELAPSPLTVAAEIEHVPLRLHLEDNLIYEPQARNNDDSDLWFWQTLGQQQKLSLVADLPVVGDGSGALRLHLWGVTHNPQVADDHDFDLVVNDHHLGTISWDGQTYHTSYTQLPIGTLKVGDNLIILDNEVEGASFLDIMQLNWLELVYMAPPVAVADAITFADSEGNVSLSGFSARPLIFNVADPESPVFLTGWTWAEGVARLVVDGEMKVAAVGPAGFQTPSSIQPLRQSNWRDTDVQADSIIITTDELAPALAPLVAARESQGLQVALVPVAEIYDEFGFGEETPQSINNFLAYTYTNWREPQPRYVLLVGDATVDYRNYLGQAPRNHIPSPMVPVYYGGETVSDSRLVDVDGDMRPNLAIGRWPVDNVGDVTSLVERTLAYEQRTADGGTLFAVDGSEAQFADMARRLWTVGEFAKEQVELLEGPQASDVIDHLNQGVWLATYIGHGSIDRWGKDNVLTIDAVSSLSGDSQPIVLQLTCLTGLFANPRQKSISEAMLAHGHGPVLLIAATSLTLSSHQEVFATALVQNLQDISIRRIGDAFQEAKLTLNIEDSSGLREISDTFVLIGDPSAIIKRP